MSIRHTIFSDDLPSGGLPGDVLTSQGPNVLATWTSGGGFAVLSVSNADSTINITGTPQNVLVAVNQAFPFVQAVKSGGGTIAVTGNATNINLEVNTVGDFQATAPLTVTSNASTVTYALTTPLTANFGGTGASSLTANGVLIGNGTGAVTFAGPATAGFVLMANGAGQTPQFVQPVAGNGITIVANGTNFTITDSASQNVNVADTTVGNALGPFASTAVGNFGLMTAGRQVILMFPFFSVAGNSHTSTIVFSGTVPVPNNTPLNSASLSQTMTAISAGNNSDGRCFINSAGGVTMGLGPTASNFPSTTSNCGWQPFTFSYFT